MTQWVDPSTGIEVQQVANDRPLPGDARPYFFISWPTPGHRYNGSAGDTAYEAISKAVERYGARRLAA